MNAQGRVPFLPYTKLRRSAPRNRLSPARETIGDHVRTVRSERKLLQRDVAILVGVTPETVGHWETNQTEPPIHLVPKIIRFLGYEPFPQPTTLQERMRVYRSRNGLSISEAARRAGVDESSWGLWERTGTILWKRYRERIEAFLAAHGS